LQAEARRFRDILMRLPVWLRAKHSHSALYGMKSRLREHGLATVCEEARCPNRAECFSKPTATFMILGKHCTRNCGFCSVESGTPRPPDMDEPRRIARAAKEMELRYVVITSVTRDDLPDGGALLFAETVRAVREALPLTRVEVLTPDFRGDVEALRTVLDSAPDVFNHNVETVPRLYPEVRPGADYGRSLNMLRAARRFNRGVKLKSGIMLGFGETREEVIEVMRDLREAGCDFLTIGQYMRPLRKNLPVSEYVRPEVFVELEKEAYDMGFGYVASSPLARSSMNAEEMYMERTGVANV
jgi:lipoic acid synthetase